MPTVAASNASIIRIDAVLRVVAFLVTIGLAECLLVKLVAGSGQQPWLIILAIALGLFLQLAVSSRYLFWFETHQEPNGIANGRFVIQSISSIAVAIWNGFWIHQHFSIQMATVCIFCITLSQIPICLRVMRGRFDRIETKSKFSQLTNFRIVDVMAILIVAATVFGFSNQVDWVSELQNPAFFVFCFVTLCTGFGRAYALKPSANLVRIAIVSMLVGFFGYTTLTNAQFSITRFETILFAVACPTICIVCCEYLLWVCFYRLHRVSE